ncbi:hypothetical protein S40293_10289 [Stachybotrys chartarum IBT 40293]|nr:hypothetical protein S40293_10289 [Stachybotrys chartarum IBT 40293]
MENNLYLSKLSPIWQIIALSTCAFAIIIACQAYLIPNPLDKFPVVGKGSHWARKRQFTYGSAWELYLEGYRMIKAGADYFRIATTAPIETIVLSPKFLDELKRLPEDVLSLSDATSEILQTPYTKVPPEVPGFIHTINASLTPALARLALDISQAVRDTMTQELPQAEVWTELKISQYLLRIVSTVSGCVFVGAELCKDEQYVDMAVNYVVEVMTAARTILLIPQFIRPFIAPFLPSTKRVKKRLGEATTILRRIVEARHRSLADSTATKPDDMLQWLIDAQDAVSKVDLNLIAQAQLAAIFASVHTTSLVTTNAVYTLASSPEIFSILKEDVKQALQCSEGQFTISSLQNMKKVDSFLKEILRFHTLSATTFNRKVIKPFRLSNGESIPAGVYVQIPAGVMAFDEDLFSDAKTFNALRFFELQQAKDKETSHSKAVKSVTSTQLVGVDQTNLIWGYGRHTCPGRFFAANELKMILAVILLHYEVKNPPGITGRHQDLWNGPYSIPDPEKTIMIRRMDHN